MSTVTPDTVKIDVEAEDQALADGWNFPSSWYIDKGVYELERQAIVSSSWQYLAPRSKLRQAGDVILGHLGDVPVMIVCDERLALRGFINACRHRGYPIVQENCKRKILVCGYHAWSYGLDGTLRRAPGLEDEQDINFKELSLIPIAVECWGEAVFGNLNIEAPSFTTTNSEIDICAMENGIDKEFSKYTFSERMTYEVNANWKLFYDNDIECYHCPTIHPKSFNEAYVTNAGEFTRYESISGQVMGHRFRPRDTSTTSGQDSALRSENYRSIRAFPGFTIAQQDDIALITQIIPTDVEHVSYVCDFYAEDGAQPDRIKRWIMLWDQTFREDSEVCELQQRTFRTGALKRNRLVPSREPGVMWVRDNIWALLKQSLTCSAT